MMFYKETNFKEMPIGEVPDDWDIIRLEDECEVIGGGTPSTKVKKYWDGRIPFVTPTDVTKQENKNMNFLDKTESYITEEGLRKSSSNLLPPGSILVTSRATIGYCVINEVPVATNQGFANIVCKTNTHNLYVLYLMRFMRKRLQELAGGSTYKEISRTMVRNLRIPLPPLPEQQKIAEVLSLVDEAIRKTSEVIAKTERLKKGLMQQLLTEGIGHKEFKDSEVGRIPKEWEVVRARNLGEVITGTTPSTSVTDYWNGGYPFVTPTDFSESKYVYRTARTVTQKGVEKARLIPKDSVLVVCIGSTIGNISLALKECITNQQINAILCKDGVNPHYVYYTIALRRSVLRAHAGITAKPIVKKTLFEQFLVPLPPLPEQQKIASILSTADKKLELERNERARLERIKQGLMDLLLTGKVRIKVN